MVRSTGSSTSEKQIKLFVVVSFIHSLSWDLTVSCEYCWLANQLSAAVTRPVGIDAWQRTKQNCGAVVMAPVEIPQ